LNTHIDTAGNQLVGRFAPFSTKVIWRQVNVPITLEGKVRSKYLSTEIEYVDQDTGELLSDKQVGMLTGGSPPIHFSERCLQRQTILDRLRPEPREFATFVLGFRNRRRGITPDVAKLCGWYAQVTGKQPNHVRRYIPKLYEAGVLEGESLVGSLFQISGRHTTAAEHRPEDVVAELKFMMLAMNGYGKGKLESLAA
jgi:hypothetical protein